VPDVTRFHRGQAVGVLDVGDSDVMFELALLDPSPRSMRTTRVRVGHRGVRLFPANHRYAWPAELDLIARLAGMQLEHRWSDWQRAPFTASGTEHISVHRRLSATFSWFQMGGSAAGGRFHRCRRPRGRSGPCPRPVVS
jgi:hypothetical protein